MSQSIQVLIADDHPSSRKGLRALLSTCPAVEVICEAENGREAVQLVEECRPDVVLMDIQMPECDGLEATRYIKARWPEVKVIALTIRAASQAAAMSAGADGFLLKGCPSKELFAAVQYHGDSELKSAASKAGAQSDNSAVDRAMGRPARLAAAVLTS